MPTYQYACTECAHSFEQVQGFSEDALTQCPQCQGRLRKLFNAVGVVFKGSGFYRNDSRGPDKSAGSGGESGKESGGSGKESGKESGSGASEKSTADSSSSGSSEKSSGTEGGSAKPAAAAGSSSGSPAKSSSNGSSSS